MSISFLSYGASKRRSLVFGWVVRNWKLEIDEEAESTHLPILHTPYPLNFELNPFILSPKHQTLPAVNIFTAIY